MRTLCHKRKGDEIGVMMTEDEYLDYVFYKTNLEKMMKEEAIALIEKNAFIPEESGIPLSAKSLWNRIVRSMQRRCK